MSNPSSTPCRGWKMDRRRPLQTLNGRLPLKLGSDRPQTLPKRVSDDPQHFIFQFFVFVSKCLQTLKVRLPPKDGSDWPGTWPQRVSDDPQHFIFRPWNAMFFGFGLDHMMIWPYGQMIIWSYDHTRIWSYDHIISWQRCTKIQYFFGCQGRKIKCRG